MRPRIVLYGGRDGLLLSVTAAVAGVAALVAKSDRRAVAATDATNKVNFKLTRGEESGRRR